ncbi:MAG TPA: MFS transporter [Firmicutes bacterium]|nr:MFS transporter [Bacillota bacterium]
MKELVKNRSFKGLMGIQTIEQIGDSLTLMALFAWVMAMPGDYTAQNMSILIFWVSLPIILIGPFSGVFIDRFKRKTLLLAATAAKGSFIFFIWRLAGNYDNIPLLYAFVFMKSFATQFFIPAKSAFVPTIVKDEKKLMIANSIAATFMVITQILTYAAAGILITRYGVESVILTAAILYMPATVMIMLLKAEETALKTKKRMPSPKQVLFELWDGLKFLFKDSKITFVTRRVFVVTVAVTVFYIALTGNYLKDILENTGMDNEEVEALGFVMAAVGLGLIAGVLMVERLLKKVKDISLIRTIFPFVGLLVIGLYFFPNFYFLLVCALAGGASAVMLFGIAETTVQKNTPVNMRGRIFASYYVFRNSGPAAATGIAGFLLLFTGEKEMVFAAGMALVIYGAVNFMTKNSGKGGK